MAEETEAADEIIDVGHGFGDTTQGIFAKRGVLIVNGQILKHQGEGRGSVFQIVDEESGHCLERFQLLGLGKALGKLDGEEARRGLIADGFEEVMVLNRKRDAAYAVAEDHDPEHLTSGKHWDT